MPIWNRISQEKVNAIFADWKSGMTYEQLSARHKVSKSAIARHFHGMRTKRAKPVTTTAIVLHSNGNGVPKMNKSKYGHLFSEIQRLRASGMSTRMIAETLHMPSTAAHYYADKIRKSLANPAVQGETNGQGHLHPQFLAGFGCAEIERAVATISQRLGVAPTLLRSGYSKFLGYSPVR